jgi:hypothetical protein
MVSLAVAAYMVMWMPGFYLTKAVVFFGQGHFLLAYLYQWKAKKIGLRYLVSYGVMVTALLVLYAFVPHPSQWLPIIAGVLFSIHLLGDELYIAGIERTKLVTTYLASFIALYTLVLVSSAYLIAVSVWVIALCLLPVLYVAYRRTREQSWSFLEMLMFLGVAHFVYALVTQARPAEVFVIFAFTIIAHYVRWACLRHERIHKVCDTQKHQHLQERPTLLSGASICHIEYRQKTECNNPYRDSNQIGRGHEYQRVQCNKACKIRCYQLRALNPCDIQLIS